MLPGDASIIIHNRKMWKLEKKNKKSPFCHMTHGVVNNKNAGCDGHGLVQCECGFWWCMWLAGPVSGVGVHAWAVGGRIPRQIGFQLG